MSIEISDRERIIIEVEETQRVTEVEGEEVGLIKTLIEQEDVGIE